MPPRVARAREEMKMKQRLSGLVEKLVTATDRSTSSGEDAERGALLIHIPKTGGTYVGQLEAGGPPTLTPFSSLGHAYLVTSPYEHNPIYCREPWRHSTVRSKSVIDRGVVPFTIVRNTWDWLVSYYVHAGGMDSPYRSSLHYDHDIASRGFDYLVNSIIERDDIWPNRKFIFQQAFCSDGEFWPRFVCRTHSLDRDLCALANRYGLRYSKRSRQRVGRKEKEDYRSLYSEELARRVGETWQREIELYGFDFESVENASAARIDRVVPEEVRVSLKYFVLEDQLFFKESEGAYWF